MLRMISRYWRAYRLERFDDATWRRACKLHNFSHHNILGATHSVFEETVGTYLMLLRDGVQEDIVSKRPRFNTDQSHLLVDQINDKIQERVKQRMLRR